MSAPSPAEMLRALLTYLDHQDVGDISGAPGRRSETLSFLIDSARRSLAPHVGPAASPFVVHRSLILGRSRAAQWLGDLVLHLWQGQDVPLDLNRILALDARHQAVALDLIRHYARMGENAPGFMPLAETVRDRRAGIEADDDWAPTG